MDGLAARERHPPGLAVLFLTEMWERFGFYTMGAMFTLYLRNPDQGFGWTAQDATVLNSYYLMFVYASPLFGGLIADRGLGYRNSVLIGGLIFMAGYLLFTVHAISAVFAALACLVVGNGFFKPNVSAMVGQLYPEGSRLKDRAYNIFYMGINIGALLAPLVAEVTTRTVGFRAGFAVAAAGMVISVTVLWCFKHLVETRRKAPADLPPPVEDAGEAAVTEDLPPRAEPGAVEAVPESRRIGALLVIFLIVIVFWMVFHQNSSTLTYWADENTAWKVSGIVANAINPFWVVTLTLPLVWFWGLLARRGLEPSTPTKMALGMFLPAASFTLLFFVARAGESVVPGPDEYAGADFRLRERSLANLRAEGVPDDVVERLHRKGEDGKYVVFDKKYATDDKGSGQEKLEKDLRKVLTGKQVSQYEPLILRQAYLFKVSPLWLILAYAVMTLGELMLSPMGLSLVSKVAPVRMRGLMMGGWFVATAVGNKLTAIGVYYDRWLQSTFFITLAGMALVMGLVLFALLRPLKKAMPGV